MWEKSLGWGSSEEMRAHSQGPGAQDSSYLLPRRDGDAPYAVHVGRVAVGVLRGREVACAVLEGLSTGCQGKEMTAQWAVGAQSPCLLAHPPLSPGILWGREEGLRRGAGPVPLKFTLLLTWAHIILPPRAHCCQGNRVPCRQGNMGSRGKVKLLWWALVPPRSPGVACSPPFLLLLSTPPLPGTRS